MTIEQRIEKLERQNRNLKLGVAGIFVAAVGALIIGQAAPAGDDIANIIRARRIEVVAESGKPAVIVGMTASGTGTVTTMDAQGNKIVTMGVAKGGEGTITTNNTKGHELIKLGVTTEGEGVIITQNDRGKKLIEIGVTTEGQPKIYSFKPDGSQKSQWP